MKAVLGRGVCEFQLLFCVDIFSAISEWQRPTQLIRYADSTFDPSTSSIQVDDPPPICVRFQGIKDTPKPKKGIA